MKNNSKFSLKTKTRVVLACVCLIDGTQTYAGVMEEGFVRELREYDALNQEVGFDVAFRIYAKSAFQFASLLVDPTMSVQEKMPKLLHKLAYAKQELDRQTQKEGFFIYPILNHHYLKITDQVRSGDLNAASDSVRNALSYFKNSKEVL